MGVLEQLLSELTKYKVYLGQGSTLDGLPSGTPSTPYYTGPGGLFGVPGLERDVISTRILPRGFASVLPASPTNVMYPLFAYLTGFQAETGTDPDGVCDDPKTAGPGKSCLQTAQFGRYSFQTRELEINRVGQQINRGEFQDLRLLNDPLITGDVNTTPGVVGSPDFKREVLMRMLEVGISFQNKLMRQLWEGNPANGNANGGYLEFPGLDILIGTGKVDALTGYSCPSLDSDIKNFNYKLVDDMDADIVNVLTSMFRYVSWIADRTNLTPVTWNWVMRPNLFYELTKVWPCSYLTSGCQFRDSTGITIQNVSANDQISMRDAMRNGQYLLIDGQQVPVVLDDAIDEDTSTTSRNVTEGCFASDIYLVPMTIRGGARVTYWEYFNYSDGPMQAVADGNLQSDFWTDGGRFLWHKKPPINWCVQWLAKIEPRIILRTPHLAGRLQNVQYCPLQHTRDPFNDDPYFVNGGVTSARSQQTLYHEWTDPSAGPT